MCSQRPGPKSTEHLQEFGLVFCFFFPSSFQPVAVQYPKAEISPVLSLNALAEFWRSRLAERRKILSLQGLRVSAWWGIQWSWRSSVHFLPCIAVCSTVIWKGVFVNHLHFLFLRRSHIQPTTFLTLEATWFYCAAGFVLTLLLRLFYLLPKVYLLYFEALALKYWEGKCCSTFLFLSGSLQGFRVAIQRYSTGSERPLARTASEKSPIIIPRPQHECTFYYVN